MIQKFVYVARIRESSVVVSFGIVILHVSCQIVSYSVLRQGILTSCALTSSHLDDFSNIVTYIL